MKALFINSVCGIGSTGKICCQLADDLTSKGYECKIAYGRGQVPDAYKKYAVKIGGTISVFWHVLMTRIFDQHGLWSVNATKKFLKWADEFNPDILWLHNIHGYYLNYKLLFDWIKKRPKMQVKWTLHDCWAFTGHCSYFTYVKCEKWKPCLENCDEKGICLNCKKCEQKSEYPKSIVFSRSNKNFNDKRKYFTGIKNLNIITPSMWLKNLLKDSMLSEYNVEVRHNEIDKNIFKPTQSDLRNKLHLENKKVILSVASIWEKRKGLNDILKLSKKLDDNYRIIIIGLTDKQIDAIKKNDYSNILTIKRTENQYELAKYYSMADVFINPSHEENYPTVNLEAEACGTKVICYDVGGSRETLSKNSILVNNINEMYKSLNVTY